MSDGTRTINLHHGTPWEKDTVTTRPFLHLEIYENEYRVSKADERLLTCLFACSVVRVNALSTNVYPRTHIYWTAPWL